MASYGCILPSWLMYNGRAQKRRVSAITSQQHCPGSAGDLIVFQRATHKHYAVNVGNGEIIHLTSAGELSSFNVVVGIAGHICSTNPSIAVIKKEKYNAFYKEGDKVYVEQHCCKNRLPILEIVKRANSKIDEKGYNLLLNNCEHFARWCCYGEWKSTQADALILFLLTATACTCISFRDFFVIRVIKWWIWDFARLQDPGFKIRDRDL